MKDKTSFVLYCDLIHTINKLPDEQAGKLFKIILDYVNDNNPIVDDLLLSISFEPIKQQLKRDLNKWTEKGPDRSEKARKAGIASGVARQLKATKTNSVVQNELKPTKRTVNVSVNDSVTVNDNNINKAKAFIGWFNESMIPVTGKKGSYRLIKTVKESFNARLKDGYVFEDFKRAFNAIIKNEYHIEKQFQYLTPEFLCRPKMLEKWANLEPVKEKGKGVGGVSMWEMYNEDGSN